MLARRTFNVVSRKYVTRSMPALGGAGHDAHGDDHHHEHKIWEKIPFSKTGVAALLLGTLFGGVGIVIFAASFQNKKHGFTKKP